MSKFKIGDKVRMVNCAEAIDLKKAVWTITSEEWGSSETKLVLLEGWSSGFYVDCLELVEELSEGDVLMTKLLRLQSKKEVAEHSINRLKKDIEYQEENLRLIEAQIEEETIKVEAAN